MSTNSHSDLTIAFKDVSYKVQVPVKSQGHATFVTPIVETAKFISSGLKFAPKKDFYRVKNISGIIKPGTMNLVLSAPGGGKSSYLKILCDRIELQSGQLAFNGRDIKSAIAEGIDVRKLTTYCDQVDCHLPLLTVTETIDFAHKMTSPFYDPQVVQNAIDLLGLRECENTIIGDALIRGVSGGQRRRVTIGTNIVHPGMLFLDEWSNGLDAATAEDIGKGLKKIAIDENKSVICTLQQPTPGLFNLFDNIVVLREGEVIFDGPREDLIPYFEGMGFRAADDVDVCDFIIDVLSQPRLSIDRQQQAERRLKKAGKVIQDNLQLSTGQILTKAETPCIDTDSMVNYYKSTPIWANISAQLDEVFPPSGGKCDVSKYPEIAMTPEAKQMYKTGYIMPVSTMQKLVLLRQFTLSARNMAVIGPRIFNSIVMGLFFGSLYYHVKQANFILRVAALLIILTQVAFGNMIEIGLMVSNNRVVYSQASWYPTWTYIVSATIASLPVVFFEILLFMLLCYFMNFNTFSAECFLVAYCICVSVGFNMGTWFRFISACVNDPKVANSLASVSVGVFMINGGFFITKDSLPKWMIWLYYISPFSWATRALINNEFHAPRYDVLIHEQETDPTSPLRRMGDIFIEATHFENGKEWIGYGILYVIGFSFVCLFLQILVMKKSFFELSIGTRRFDEEEMSDSDMDQEGEGAAKLNMLTAAEGGNHEDEHEEHEEHEEGGMERNFSSNSLVRDASSFNQSTLKTLREALPFSPTWLSFSHVKYTVQVQKDGQTVDRLLLNDVNGYAEPGKLTALMGASGAGKTTLLDVLAGRKNAGVIEGTIMLNGRVPTPNDFASITGYVEQFDSLFAFDTVRETLRFAARLRLPASVHDDIKEKIVDEVLEILDLTSIENYLIGNSSIMGLSPSQLKRVNIGVELVANPSVLFLDEPTTGLDSKAAQTVMRVVKRIARSGRAIICTIHQPSSELAYLFDRLCLLGSGGHQIFFGDVGSRFTKFIKYLQSIPGVQPCKPRYNPASWMLEELGVGVASLKDTDSTGPQETQEETIQRFKEFYFKSRVARRVFARLHALENLTGVEEDIEYSVSRNTLANEDRSRSYSVSTTHAPLPTGDAVIQQKDAPSVFYQFKVVQTREFFSYWRNPGFVYSRLIIVTFISLLFSCLYYGLNIRDESTVIAALSARVISTVFASLFHCGIVLPLLFENRATYYRERSSNMYLPMLTTISTLVNEIVWILLDTIFFVNVIYWMLDFNQTATAYFAFFLAFFWFSYTFVAIAALISSITPSLAQGQILEGLMYNLILSFLGLSITKRDIAAGYLWLFEAMIASHITHMIVDTQFTDVNKVIDTFALGQLTVAEYVEYFTGMKYGQFGMQFLYSVIFTVVVIILALFATQKLVFSSR